MLESNIDFAIESFLYRTWDYDQNHKNSHFREMRKLGLSWIRRLIIIAYLGDKTSVLTYVDESFGDKHVEFLKIFDFKCTFGGPGSGPEANFRTLLIEFG